VQLAAAVVAAATIAVVVISAAAYQNDDKKDNPSAGTAATKEIVTHNCLPPFGLQYIILHRHKTCYT
jgi:hypothetical protein